MDDALLRRIFNATKTIAIIGAKDAPGQPVDAVGRYLLGHGFQIVPVHPVRKTVWGLAAAATVTDIAETIDLVDVFRAPQYCPEHARELLRMRHKPLCFWLQLGISSPEAMAILADTGISVIQNACTKIEHQRLMG